MSFDKGDFKDYLSMIQVVITRMENNSFLVKGWAITIVSAIMSFAAANKLSFRIYFIAAAVTIAFCIIDCFYLRTQRLYRNLYKKVINEGLQDLSLVRFFDLDASNCKDKNTKLINVFLSNSIWTLYSTILLGILFIAL